MAKFLSFVFCETTKKQLDAMAPEMRLRFYDAITDYGIYGKEPELSDLERLIWIPIKDLIDNSKQNRGGAPAGNQNARKQPQQVETVETNKNEKTTDSTETTQNNQNNVVLVETTEQPKQPLSNGNVNGNGNGNDKGKGNVNVNDDPQVFAEAVYVDDGSPRTELARVIFDELKAAKLPCCGQNFIGFMQRDFKSGLEVLHARTDTQGLHSNDLIGAVKNYIQVVNNSCAWNGWRSKKTFDRFCSWEKFKDFLPDNFVLENFLDAEKLPAQVVKTTPKKNCPICGMLIAKSAKGCPHCGYSYEQTPEEFRQNLAPPEQVAAVFNKLRMKPASALSG